MNASLNARKMTSGLAALLVAGVAASTTQAAPGFWTSLDPNLVAYDPFLSGDARGDGEYTAGQDMRTMGAAAYGWVGTGGVDGFGVAHSGSTSNFVANAVGEDSTAVGFEQGGRMQWLGVGNSPFDRNLTRQLNPIPSSNEWWFSIHTNRLGWADPGGFPNDAANSTYAVGGFTGAGGDGLQVGYDDTAGDGLPDLVLRMGGANRTLAADTASSANQYVLVQLLVNESGNDTVNVWADPASLTGSIPADLTFTDTNVSDSLTPFTQSKYESPGQSGPVFWDEIRLGTTFEAVTEIPEPTTLALLGITGGLALLRRSRA